MTIDALRVTTNISGKTRNKRWTKRCGRPNSLSLRLNSGERFGPQKIQARTNFAVLLFRRHALWRTLRALPMPTLRSQRLRR
jgi:hypothetical protein